MRLENEFTVQASVEQVWRYLLDVEKVAPCMPGAELTEIVDDRTYKGKATVKVGPVSLAFAGTVMVEERDEENRRVVMKAQGMEQRGKGAATAVVVSRLEPVDGGTRVVLETDLTITGAVAQYGRGMIQDISQRLTGEFARCLQANLAATVPAPAAPVPAAEAAAPAPAAVAPPPAVARPVKGLRLGLWALWRAAVRFFQRLLGGRAAV